MRRNDLLLIGLVLAISFGLFFAVQMLEARSRVEDGSAEVLYQGVMVLSIDLEDGTPTVHEEAYVIEIDEDEQVYVVEGTLGPVTIAYEDHGVNVIDQTSPRDICEHQGHTNSPYKALTCLPNDVVIRIRRAADEDTDGIIQ